MSLDTLIASSLALPDLPARDDGPARALVLMGGGARTAYQAGVLRGLAHLLARQAGGDGTAADAFPFQLLVGTSAGALNASFLASQAGSGIEAFAQLASFWRAMRSDQVYRLQATRWWSRRFWGGGLLSAGLTLARQVRTHRALLDTMPLVDTLHRQIDMGAIETVLERGTLQALAVTASSYSSGEHWTFCQAADGRLPALWRRPGRRAEAQPVTIEHLMASSAIPFLFPAVPLWVDGHKEFFGDGSMRQLSPLSPAIQLGARQVLVIGVGQPQRAGLTGPADGRGLRTVKGRRAPEQPSAGTIAGHAMASVFHDTLQADVEQAQRVSRTLLTLPPELAARLPYRPLEVLAIQPSASLDELALRHAAELPEDTRDTLRGLGVLSTSRAGGGSGAALASYLLFEPGFVNALLALGEADALARRDELLAFFAPVR